jgi:hypothetical protein
MAIINELFRSSEAKESFRGSNASEKKLSSSVSIRVQNSGTHSRPESASRTSREQNTQTRKVELKLWPQSLHRKTLIALNRESSSRHSSSQQYSANVISGAASLGIEIPSYLRHALIDQHGELGAKEYWYSKSVGEIEISTGSDYLDFGDMDACSRHDQWSMTHRKKSDDSIEYLTEIGTQFDDWLLSCNYS